MSLQMFTERIGLSKTFATLISRERFLPDENQHVARKPTGHGEILVTLITRVRSLSGLSLLANVEAAILSEILATHGARGSSFAGVQPHLRSELSVCGGTVATLCAGEGLSAE